MQGLSVPEPLPTIGGMSTDDRKSFWQRLSDAYYAKHKQRLTQQKAGALIGATQGTGKRWAHGGKPSMENACEIAVKLGVCVEWLLTGRGNRCPLSKEEQQILGLFSDLPHEERIKLIGHLEWSRQTRRPLTDEPNYIDVNLLRSPMSTDEMA